MNSKEFKLYRNLGFRPKKHHAPKVGANIIFRIIGTYVIVVMLVQILLSPPVLANGNSIEILQTVADPYLISIRSYPTPPIAGNVHLTLTVRGNKSPKEPLYENVSISVTALRPTSGQNLGPIDTQKNLGVYYDVSIPIMESGEWILDINITGPEGEARTRVSITVEEAPPLDPKTTGILIIAAIFAIGYIIWWARATGSRSIPR
jgi:hypothetical protein